MYFIAKFAQVSEESTFTADKNGNLPYIGKLLAGKAHTTIVNGTIFEREELKANKPYLCTCEPAMDSDGEQMTTTDGDPMYNVVFVDEVGVRDLIAMSKECGKPVLLNRKEKANVEEVAQAVEAGEEDPFA